MNGREETAILPRTRGETAELCGVAADQVRFDCTVHTAFEMLT